MIVNSKRNNDESVDLDIKLEREDVLDFEEGRIKNTIGLEKYKLYEDSASEGKFNNIPYNYIRGYACNSDIFRPTGVRLREYFREKYSNKDV